MSGPRNLKAYRAALRVRAQVRAILAARSQLQEPITAAEVRRMLPPDLRRSLPTIANHMRRARIEAQIEALPNTSGPIDESDVVCIAP